MEQIKFVMMDYVKDFLSKEGGGGKQTQLAVDEYQGALFENMQKAGAIKQVNSDPRIFSLRVKYSGIFFRLLGPKIKSCIYFVHGFKKKSDRIPPSDMQTAVKRTNRLIQSLNLK